MRTYKGIISHYKPKSKAAAKHKPPAELPQCGSAGGCESFSAGKGSQQQKDKKGLQCKQSRKERMLPEHLSEGTPAHDGSVLFVGAPVVHGLQLEFKIPGVLGQLAR